MPDELHSFVFADLAGFTALTEAHGDAHAGADGQRPEPVDPVCRMAIDPARAAERRVHRGVEYHFCSSACAAAFDAGPRRFTHARRSGREILLISDRSRDRAALRLKRAYTSGRLTQEELEERTQRLLHARTRRDLAVVTEALPRRRSRAPFPFRFFSRLMRRLRRRRR